MTHKMFNASNLLGAAAFLAMILAPGAVEGGNYILAVALIAAMAVCAYLSDRESGKRK